MIICIYEINTVSLSMIIFCSNNTAINKKQKSNGNLKKVFGLILAAFFANSEYLDDVSDRHDFSNPLAKLEDSMNKLNDCTSVNNYGILDGPNVDNVIYNALDLGIEKLDNKGDNKFSEPTEEYYDCICPIEDEDDFKTVADQDGPNFEDLEEVGDEDTEDDFKTIVDQEGSNFEDLEEYENGDDFKNIVDQDGPNPKDVEEVEDYGLARLFNTLNADINKNLEEVEVNEAEVNEIEVEEEKITKEPEWEVDRLDAKDLIKFIGENILLPTSVAVVLYRTETVRDLINRCLLRVCGFENTATAYVKDLMEKYFNILFILSLTVFILCFISMLMLRKINSLYFYWVCSLIATILSFLTLLALLFVYFAQVFDAVGASSYCLRICLLTLKKFSYFIDNFSFLKQLTRIDENTQIIIEMLNNKFKKDTFFGIAKDMWKDLV